MKFLSLGVAAVCGLAVLSGLADGPDGMPVYEGTVKESAGIPRDFFARLLPVIESRKDGWMAEAERVKPKLRERIVKPVRLVTPHEDPKAFLGWRLDDAGAPETAYRKPLAPGDVLYFDFGEHLTGRFAFRLGRFDAPVDAPVRLRFVFGEVPAEVVMPCDGNCRISLSWHQDETVTTDYVPSVSEIPRRLSFRYVKVVVVACSPNGRFALDGLEMRATTSADDSRLQPFRGSADDIAIDRVSNQTLRECMQTVLEDGPKRDRRLWLGDLRLQALANYSSYRNYDVVKRSMLLLSGTCLTNGLVATAVYERPFVENDIACKILDFTAIYPNLVQEYLDATGDRETCESLWPLVLKQLDFTLEAVDSEGLVRTELPWWQFIDWQPEMKRQAAEQAVIVYSLKATEKLAARLGHSDEVAFVPQVIAKMSEAAHRHLWDAARGVWVSNGDNVSWMSQAWMALAGISTEETARMSLRNVMADPKAIKPVTPYAHHYFTEALFTAGMREEALRHLHWYWGGMVALGADTYWEVWVPGNQRQAAYDNILINSFCHAFSCTPGYLLRRYAK